MSTNLQQLIAIKREQVRREIDRLEQILGDLDATARLCSDGVLTDAELVGPISNSHTPGATKQTSGTKKTSARAVVWEIASHHPGEFTRGVIASAVKAQHPNLKVIESSVGVYLGEMAKAGMLQVTQAARAGAPNFYRSLRVPEKKSIARVGDELWNADEKAGVLASNPGLSKQFGPEQNKAEVLANPQLQPSTS